jgi:hypothetical protein
LYARLAERGHRVVRFAEDIEARRPRTDEASFLKLTEAQQVLVVVRVAYGIDGMPLETVFHARGVCQSRPAARERSGRATDAGRLAPLP